MGPEQRLVEPTSGNTGMGLAMSPTSRATNSPPRFRPRYRRVMLKFAGAKVEELEDTLYPAPGAPEGHTPWTWLSAPTFMPTSTKTGEL